MHLGNHGSLVCVPEPWNPRAPY